VQEFPDEMQGRMGEVMILQEDPFDDKGKPKSRTKIVADAVGNQYILIQEDSANATLNSVEEKILTLADRLDSLCLMMAHGVEVSENKDPLGLRRLAMGVLTLLDVKNQPPNTPLASRAWKKIFSLHTLVELGLQNLRLNLTPEKHSEAKEKICSFIGERLKGILQSQGFESETILVVESRLAQDGFSKTCFTLEDLKNNITHSAFFEAREIQKRLKNTLKNIDLQKLPPIKSELLLEDCEAVLFSKIQLMESQQNTQENTRALQALEKLNAAFLTPLETFFKGVMVFDKENLSFQENRLALLAKIYAFYAQWGDFSHLSQLKSGL
jgi:glycyl-tRNA synthetase beta subunit